MLVSTSFFLYNLSIGLYAYFIFYNTVHIHALSHMHLSICIDLRGTVENTNPKYGKFVEVNIVGITFNVHHMKRILYFSHLPVSRVTVRSY